MGYAITVDTGGTFSDLVLADDERILGLYKAETMPDDVFAGVADALALAAADIGVELTRLLAETTSFVYSTTHATNAILEGRTARTAFLTTEGHPDILLYREGGKDQPLNIAMPYPKPYVPRSLTFELKERVLADGSVHRPLDEAHLREVIARLAELKVEAVGVCLLWSVVNPAHEARVGALLAEHLRHVAVTLGHRINRISREYRRASSTVIDASLKRLMRSHLTDVDARLRALGFAGEPLMVTHLSGGVQRLDEACEYPLHAVDSGPALAPVSGLTYAAVEPDLGRRDLIVVDAGGTSCDVSPTRAGRVVYTREKWLGQRWKGHMTGLPAVDTRSVGAGGGSIASVDAGGLLHVGPESAGAVPGPACYGRGGEQPDRHGCGNRPRLSRPDLLPRRAGDAARRSRPRRARTGGRDAARLVGRGGSRCGDGALFRASPRVHRRHHHRPGARSARGAARRWRRLGRAQHRHRRARVGRAAGARAEPGRRAKCGRRPLFGCRRDLHPRADDLDPGV